MATQPQRVRRGSAAAPPRDLVTLVNSTANSTVYPPADSLVSVLQARFRADAPYTRIGDGHLVLVNPNKLIQRPSSDEELLRACYDVIPDGETQEQAAPHIAVLAVRAYLLMARRGEDQVLVTRGATASGKSYAARQFLNAVIGMGRPTKSLSAPAPSAVKQPKGLYKKVLALQTLLDSFGHARTVSNGHATRVGLIWEIGYSLTVPDDEDGSLGMDNAAPQGVVPEPRLASAQVLTYGLDKWRAGGQRLDADERTFHVFYQLLAGATTAERDELLLEDPSDYTLLATSGCYRTLYPKHDTDDTDDDAVHMASLRNAFAVLGFKRRHVQGIFAVLTAVLVLSNLVFQDGGGPGDKPDGSAWVSSIAHEGVYDAANPTIQHVAHLLGVGPEDLLAALTNRTGVIKHKGSTDTHTIVLTAAGAASQRDALMRDLYALLFMFVVETGNMRLANTVKKNAAKKAAANDAPPSIDAPGGKETVTANRHILVLDQPGWQTRGAQPAGSSNVPSVALLGAGSDRRASLFSMSGLAGGSTLVSPYAPAALPEFLINFGDELLHAHVLLFALGGDDDASSLTASSSVMEVLRGPINVGLDPAEARGRPSISGQPSLASATETVRPRRGDCAVAARKPGGMIGILDKASKRFMSGKISKNADSWDDEVLQEFMSKYGDGMNSVFSAGGPGAPRTSFQITHYMGQCMYSLTDTNNTPGSPDAGKPGFVELNADVLDASLVSLLRSSVHPFIAKVFAGPGLAVERHDRDASVIVQAQVSSRPMRNLDVGAPGSSTAGLTLDGIGATTGAMPEAYLDPGKPYPQTTQLNETLIRVLAAVTGEGSASRRPPPRLSLLSCIRANDSRSANSFRVPRVRQQLVALSLSEMVARAASVGSVMDITMDLHDWCARYVPNMRGTLAERLEQSVRKYGWRDGVDYTIVQHSPPLGGDHILFGDDGAASPGIGAQKISMTYAMWKMVEDTVRVREREQQRLLGIGMGSTVDDGEEDEDDPVAEFDAGGETYGGYGASPGGFGGGGYAAGGYAGAMPLPSPRLVGDGPFRDPSEVWGSEYDKKGGDAYPDAVAKDGAGSEQQGLIVNDAPKEVEEVPSSRSRRTWLWTTWALTWWIPDFLLSSLGRMKRPDIRLAWREKLAICILIFFFNGLVLFYIIGFGKLLCPDYDKAWNEEELSEHSNADDDDFWVAVRGQVYDVSKFVKTDHSDISSEESNSATALEYLGGTEMTDYFPPPLVLGCKGLVTDDTMVLQYENFTDYVPTAIHTSGALQTESAGLSVDDWYTATFLPKMKTYYIGSYVFSTAKVEKLAEETTDPKYWAIFHQNIFDLTDYFYTIDEETDDTSYEFLDSNLTTLFKENAGQDITSAMDEVLAKMNTTYHDQNMACLRMVFYVGKIDFRDTARCQVQNYMLLVASAILMGSMGIKFLAALQFHAKRTPELQDKFILCQVPCYTEGEESLRRTIDSLAGLNYDDKRKLIFIICDGNITGSGNERPTPRIVLDLLGVDPKLDPEPLLFKSIGEGSKALNYAKVYSGLYEFEGHVVPYMVIVKVGKPTERSKPGNRGKRDSQILVMNYLNRVHFDAPMNPLELEIYHQMRNVIGIDPAFYEYIFTVDADTNVSPESLNRLVASSADDSRIIGICGETRLENPEGSWWTMIQVYEYYISHNMAKAFESLFGSVTCLPGCFTLYRLRTADKGRPIIISNRIIDEYSEPNVDTLHKKNLFSLGEDRFLTTLLLKHFPTFKTKYNNEALCRTVAPESWRVLFSQRRRWINSTVHNLCELAFLPELFNFCCFSMRFFVFLDLIGTIILPATVIYLCYLIVVVAIGSSAFPTIAIIMLGVTYGLQALIFILRREFMLIGWMVVYLLSYPVYSFFLPIYSFWCMDEFGWGNTRLVIGEGKDKKVIINEDEKFDDSMIPLKKFSEYEAETWALPSADGTGYSMGSNYDGKPHSVSRAPISRSQSPQVYNQSSQAGDFYRDTNVMSAPGSAVNLRTGGSQMSHSNLSHEDLRQPMMPHYGSMVQLPYVPFNQGPGSVAGSDYGGQVPMQMPPMGYNTSMYGMMPPGAMNLQMTGGMVPPQMAGMMGNNFTGGSFGSQGMAPPQMPAATGGGMRPMSTFSVATTANLFSSGPSMDPNPADEDLVNALRAYLSTQDLMTVTKKTVREAIMARFPRADLSSRKDFLNRSIDTILSES
ncbi:hypothetical protein FISHEDRAFT_77147 [Fistulina hepatica ATCC 64428]|uniref:chitin synthase n=1 Tax=Fistulina hepatica ATCC 64428 TaxID=1128425 RepID=A0A0D7A2A1_9AGAR|nr:hypothetical protein FISHEDRAFT_77147 [Fistulina hepatica ATCC 64428]